MSSERTAITTLLLVDDSPADRLAIRRFLTTSLASKTLESTSANTYTIVEADSGESGLALLAQQSAQQQFDLVLLDYRLPDLDGLEFMHRLKAICESPPPVVMLTGHGNERVAAEAIKSGAHDYIVKHNQMADVLRLAVRTTLKEVQLQQSLAAYQSQQSLIQDIALRIRESLSLKDILGRAVQEVQQLLACDRAIIYRFLPNGTGIVEVETVQPQWTSIQHETIEDSCFKNGWLGEYLTGKTTSVEDINNSELSSCHIKLLNKYQVQANLVVPIILASTVLSSTLPDSTLPANKQNSENAFTIQQPTAHPQDTTAKTLWGLLIVHQCAEPRRWKTLEINLLKQLSGQLAIAVQQAQLYQQLQTVNHQLEKKVQARTQELQAANAALKASNQDLEQFAYIASHDLREPLRKVKSFADLLSRRYRDQLDETGDRYIDYITDGAVRMQQLITDLLTYSRLGKHELVKTTTDLHQVLHKAQDNLSEQIEQKQATITVESLPVIQAEPLQLEQLFRNLIENGLKYNNSPSPTINIAAKQQGTDWIISIRDNGIGIEPQFYDRIFTIFQRLHPKSEYSGTGIGLAICKKIVNRHGGHIEVTSQPGEGTTFWCTLPAQQRSQTKQVLR